MNKNDICLVSGLPRSGTSMMMHLLDVAGVPLLVDTLRQPDADNPRGYYEYEPVKQLKTDAHWLGEAQGKAVKVISYFLPYLPAGFSYRILFMQRPLDEILASQHQMILRHGKDNQPDLEQLKLIYQKHLRHVQGWLNVQPHVNTLFVDYPRAIATPLDTARNVAAFLDLNIDPAPLAAAIEPALYRQKLP